MLEFLRRQLALLVEQRAALVANVDAVLTPARTENRSTLTDTESSAFDAEKAKLLAHDERTEQCRTDLAQAEDTEKRAAAHAAASKDYGNELGRGPAHVTDPVVYARGNREQSYFRDLAKSQLFNDRDANERMRRHVKAASDVESRALGNTNTTGGSGGEFAPPEWLVADYIALARAGRVTADLYNHMDVPSGVSSVNLPRVLTGTTVAIQSTQNTALSQTDMTTGSVSTGFTTVGGKQVVAQQLLDQSEINFDQVITSDLAAAYSQNVGSQIINGAGTGANNNSVVNGLMNATVPGGLQSTYTSGTPTAAAFYSKAAGMISGIVTARFAEPTCWLMAPRRFYWLLAQVDSTGRPLVVPAPMAYNAMGTIAATPAAGGTGFIFLGLPVYIDPQLPVNLGAGTNQDSVFLLKQDDLWMLESSPRAEVFREPYADSVGVLFRLYSYVGTILNRYSNSIATMNGTGLTTPAF